MRRILAHLFATRGVVTRAFPPRIGEMVERAVSEAEKAHDIQLRVVVEAGLPFTRALARQAPRQRALELFSLLRVWDTEHNSGVLIYVLMADRKIEIVADRGINAKVAQAEWDRICQHIVAEFRGARFEQGVLLGINEILSLLRQHVPARTGAAVAELPDAPVVL